MKHCFMRRKTVCFILMGLFVLCGTLPVRAAQPVESKTVTVKSGPASKQVKAVYIDLNNPRIQITPVLAGSQIGRTEALAAMARRVGAAAAINGTFFNSYSDMKPQGNIEINGQYLYLNNTGSSFIVNGSRQVSFETARYKINGTVDGPSKAALPAWEQYQRNWYAWSINRNNTSAGAINIFTPAYGAATPNPNAATVTVQGDAVTAKGAGITPIPTGGFVIAFDQSADAQKYVSRFEIGDTVRYEVSFTTLEGTALVGGQPLGMIGAGPMLVKNGQVVFNPAREGMNDPKITSMGGARSLVGLTADNRLVLATVSGATVRQWADIAQKMGLVQAMNLDGGASSSLYCAGKYITSPGRNLSNCIAITLQ